jgi:hypothetical protein
MDLPPGVEIRVDFTLSRGRRFNIRGRLIDGTTGRPPQSAAVSVSPRNPSGESSALDAIIPGGLGQDSRYNAATGEFEVRDVLAGSYWLQVTAQGMPLSSAGRDGDVTAAARAALASAARTQVPVDVAADIENLTVTVSPGITIPGRLRIEGTQASGQTGFGRITLLLQSGGNPLLSLIQGGGPVRIIAADGTFAVSRVTPGDYKLVVNGMDPNMYIKDARLGPVDVLQGVSIGDRADGSLEITLSANGGQIEGTIVDSTGKAIGGVQGVLVPDRLRNRTDLYKTAISGQDGWFTLRGITPGDYRLFAWEDIEPFSYFDPEVLKPYEQYGTPVRIQENSRETAEVKIIAGAVQ